LVFLVLGFLVVFLLLALLVVLDVLEFLTRKLLQKVFLQELIGCRLFQLGSRAPRRTPRLAQDFRELADREIPNPRFKINREIRPVLGTDHWVLSHDTLP